MVNNGYNNYYNVNLSSDNTRVFPETDERICSLQHHVVSSAKLQFCFNYTQVSLSKF